MNSDTKNTSTPISGKKSTNFSPIQKVYKENFEKIYKFFYFKVRSQDIAEDLAEDTFLSFVENIAKNETTIENLVGFLYGIAKNVFMNYLKEKYKQEIPVVNFGENFGEYMETFVSKAEKGLNYEDILNKFLPKVPEKQRTILSLRFIDKLSLQEIADNLAKDMNYVKTTQKRGIASIRKLIELEDVEGVHQDILND